MSGRDPLPCLADKRWHWLHDALARIYAELEPGDEPLAVSVTAASGAQVINYGCAPISDVVHKRLISDPARAHRVGGEVSIDITPPDSL